MQLPIPARKRWICAMGLILLVICDPVVTGCGRQATDAAVTPLRRIILITCDTLSARHLRAYGYETATTTTLDSLAARGVLFKHCLAPQGWTLSSHMSLLTGLAPGVHLVSKGGALASTIPTLPEILHERGFRTGGFPTSNHWLDKHYGFNRGFQVYSFFPYEVVSNLALPVADWIAGWARDNVPLQGEAGAAAPFFLFLHFMDVHIRPASHPFPYWTPEQAARDHFGLPPIPIERKLTRVDSESHDFEDVFQWDLELYDKDQLRRGYDACIRSWDEHRLRKILLALEGSGYLRDTLIIITADHGEQIAEHGGYYHTSPYAEVREVPLLFLWPGRLPAGAVVETPVSLLDVFPTVLDLADLPVPEVCQGLSLRPLLNDEASDFPRRDFLIDGYWRFCHLTPTALLAQVRDQWWSLVVNTDTTGAHSEFRPARVDSIIGLFNLTEDPGEQRDLQVEHPDVVAELRGRLEDKLAHEARLGRLLTASAPGTEVEITPEIEQELKALGY